MFLPQFVFAFLLKIIVATSTSLHGAIPPAISSHQVLLLTSRDVLATMLCLGGIGGIFYYHKTNLWEAVQDNDFERVKSTISWGADVNQKNHLNITPLYVAINSDRFEIMRFLLHKNAHVNVHNYEKKTPLDYALKKKDDRILLCLLLHNATDYDLHSEVLSDKETKIFSSFRTYSLNKSTKQESLCTLLSSKEYCDIFYEKKDRDAIAFGFRNNDHKGLEYCREQKVFANTDIVSVIACNRALTKFLSRYLEYIDFNLYGLRDFVDETCFYDNEYFIHAFNAYVKSYKALKESKFFEVNGDPVIIKKVLSYLNFDLE